MTTNYFDWEVWQTTDALGLAATIREESVPLRSITAQLAEAVNLQNPKLNAVVELFDDVIEAPERSGANPNGPFYGVPILIKDMGSRIEGRNQQIGLAFKNSMPAEMDDPLIENFRAAGFIVAGRTAVPESGMTFITHSIPQGDTLNPFNLEHTPGGSSGGSSAAVSGGITPICSASDGAGSIRFPAAWTGLVGLKVTRGLNPLPRGLNESIMPGAAEGAVVRSVRDCAAVTQALAVHPYLGGSFMPPLPTPDLRTQEAQTARRFRIGYSIDSWGTAAEVDSEVVRATKAMAARLADLGHQMVPLAPEDICDFTALRDTFAVAEWLLPISRELMYERDLANAELDDHNSSSQLRNHIELADRYDIDDLFVAKLGTEALMRRWGAFWQQGPCDLLLSPVTPIKCPRVDSSYRMDSDQPFDDWFAGLFDGACFTITANHMGLPALSLPAGLDGNNCPIGVQFMAPWHQEKDLLHLGFQIERAHPELFRMKPEHRIRF